MSRIWQEATEKHRESVSTNCGKFSTLDRLSSIERDMPIIVIQLHLHTYIHTHTFVNIYIGKIRVWLSESLLHIALSIV